MLSIVDNREVVRSPAMTHLDFGFVEYANVDGILIRNLEIASQLNGHPVSVSGGNVIR